MNHHLPKTINYLFIVAIIIGVSLVACNDKSMNGMLIVTKIPTDNVKSLNEIITPNLPRAELVVVQMKDDRTAEINLTPDFYSACSPNLSYDAKKILFLGQKKQDEPWQVWEMNLQNKNYRKLTDFEASCYTPYYLPGEQFVFSKDITDSVTGTSRMLFTMNLDGTNLQQITYHPHNDYVQSILRDGRILMLSQQVYPQEGKIKTLAMRPNGTKAELFYSGNAGNNSGFRFCETNSGIIFFTEMNNESLKKRNLVSIHQNRPLHSKINYSENIEGNFYSVFPNSANELFVSYRPAKNKTIGLYKFSTKEKTFEKTLIDDTDHHYLDPIFIEFYQRPKALPNELKTGFFTGLIMCQDINQTAQKDTSIENIAKATKIEILGIDKSLGIIPVEEDGSFFLKITADLPFRFQSLDKNNMVVNEPSDWIWVRPFERRGCVGCHEDPELTPENKVPMAVNKWPVLVISDSINSKINKKTFELGDMH